MLTRQMSSSKLSLSAVVAGTIPYSFNLKDNQDFIRISIKKNLEMRQPFAITSRILLNFAKMRQQFATNRECSKEFRKKKRECAKNFR